MNLPYCQHNISYYHRPLKALKSAKVGWCDHSLDNPSKKFPLPQSKIHMLNVNLNLVWPNFQIVLLTHYAPVIDRCIRTFIVIQAVFKLLGCGGTLVKTPIYMCAGYAPALHSLIDHVIDSSIENIPCAIISWLSWFASSGHAAFKFISNCYRYNLTFC